MSEPEPTDARKRLVSFFERGFDGVGYAYALETVDAIASDIEREAAARAVTLAPDRTEGLDVQHARSMLTAAVYGEDAPPRWFVDRVDDVIRAVSPDLTGALDAAPAPDSPDPLREAARLVDEGWHVVEGDEGRTTVRLRYASDLPARLNALRDALTGDDPKVEP